MAKFRRLFAAIGRHPIAASIVLLLFGLVAYGVGRQIWAQSHYRAALRALETCRLTRAQEHLAKCLQIWPKDAQIHFLAAQAARRAGNLAEANQLLEKCERLSPRLKNLTLERILLQFQRGNVAGNVEKILWSWVK